MRTPSVLILGTRGIPAAHGGFETFAEKLALFLRERGWAVGVYCQSDGPRTGQRFRSEHWNGVELIHVEVAAGGPLGTLEFDYFCVQHAGGRDALCLVLGYNGAVFLPWLRLKGRTLLTNMDGIEWCRPKWPFPVKAWFWVNEWIAAWASHRLVADHPIIADHLATRRPRKAIATIPYGGDPVLSAPTAPLEPFGLEPGRYFVSIARIEPDNNILTLVEAFSQRHRDARLVVLGTLSSDNAYHRSVLAAASDEVVFPGAIYDSGIVQSLRFHARAYLHGHTVGGTNPSLVEALWAGSAVIAHDNAYNRGTAGEAQAYFSDTTSCSLLIDRFLHDDLALKRARDGARAQARSFDWTAILSAYEDEMLRLGGFDRVPALAQDAARGIIDSAFEGIVTGAS